MAFKSGYVIIAGRTNVGKSTLFNALVGERLSIISPKPQTTRNNILGIVTDKQAQMIFLDTPGILSARYRLHEFMNRQIGRAYQSADVLLGIVDGSEFDTSYDAEVRQIFGQWDIPKIIAINKTDLISRQQAQHCEKHIRASLTTQTVLSVAAISGQGIQDLHTALRHALPEGPQYYPEDMLTEQPERFFVAELIRKKCSTTCVKNCLMQRQSTSRLLKKTAPKSIFRPISLSSATLKKALSSGGGAKPSKPLDSRREKKSRHFWNAQFTSTCTSKSMRTGAKKTPPFAAWDMAYHEKLSQTRSQSRAHGGLSLGNV